MTALLAVALSLVANEIFAVSPWCAAKLVRWAASRRYADPDRAKIRAEEWTALVDRQPGNLVKLATAAGFVGSAVAHTALNAIERRLIRVVEASRREHAQVPPAHEGPDLPVLMLRGDPDQAILAVDGSHRVEAIRRLHDEL